ncbi:MAG: SurA N-terminal domain-containing protein [Candidatus Omnitrophica bacterium]|jgi:peptidyl-prolyl cis-trans isomerase SurA|nr:SurA N-terminal domain-containing protein [Candidatus Omnitrophota bacterium]
MTKFKCQNKSKIQKSNSKTKVLSFVICALILFCHLCFGICHLVFAEDKIIAVVNNDIITQKDLNDFINFTRIQLRQQYSGKQLESRIQAMKLDLIHRLIEDKLILQEAKRLNIITDESRVNARIDEIKAGYRTDLEYQNALKHQGLVQADLEKKIKEQFLMFNVIEYKIKSRIVVSPSEVTDFFNSHGNELQIPEQRELDVINAGEDIDKAKEVYSSLKGGASLEDILKKYALLVDTMSAGERGQFRKEIEDVIYGLKPQEYSELVKIDTNYYIFKLKSIVSSRTQNLIEAREKIYTYLFNRRMEEEMSKWLEELKKKSYVKIFE